MVKLFWWWIGTVLFSAISDWSTFESSMLVFAAIVLLMVGDIREELAKNALPRE